MADEQKPPRVPLLSKKRPTWADVDPNSLTAALHADEIQANSAPVKPAKKAKRRKTRSKP